MIHSLSYHSPTKYCSSYFLCYCCCSWYCCWSWYYYCFWSCCCFYLPRFRKQYQVGCLVHLALIYRYYFIYWCFWTI